LSKEVIKKYIPIQNKESAQLSFLLNKKIISNNVTVRPNEIVLTLMTKEIKEDDYYISEKIEKDKELWEINSVVIDAGHGGKDPGAIGKAGTKEKDINLLIAKYLKDNFEKNSNIKVYMTRDDDNFISLNERTEYANKKNGKLFISIHCNAAKSRAAQGFEVYFLSPAKTKRAMEVAAFENEAIKYESNNYNYKKLTDENFIILSMMQANFTKESEILAQELVREVRDNLPISERGVDQAGFYVLVGASMPAILVEAGFLSNQKEEELLKTTAYQKRLAKAIFDAVINMKENI